MTMTSLTKAVTVAAATVRNLPFTAKACMALASIMPLMIGGLVSAIHDGNAVQAAAFSPMVVLSIAATVVLAEFFVSLAVQVRNRARRERLRMKARVSSAREVRTEELLLDELRKMAR